MKKILFNDRYKLTDAVLSGRKTQTRRIVSQSVIDKYSMMEDFTIIDDARYNVGEVVAIAQSYASIADYYQDPHNASCAEHYELNVGKSSCYCCEKHPGFRNKMFVAADRMIHHIRITDVRVERLQDISDEDCIAEGVGISATDNRIGMPFSIPFNYYIGKDERGCRYSTPRESYAALIDRISGKGVFQSNPYVFVYDFELVD